MIPTEDITELLERISDLEIERDHWRECAEDAVRLIEEWKRMYKSTKRFLDHATSAAA